MTMHTDRWTSVRTLLPLALLQSCAQVVADAPDAGLAGPPQVTQVDPSPGPVAGDAQFRVTFSTAMDLSLLLSQPDRSESVVLVSAANVELIASALVHGKLTATQRSLLVDATATPAADATRVTLAPKSPLPGGSWYLLISSHLKDATGKKMLGNGARYAFAVEKPAPLPHLEAPLAGWAAPVNLKRVRVSFPDGPPEWPVTVTQRDGGVIGGPQTSDGGPLVLELRGMLGAEGEYALAQDGREVVGTSFRASSCARRDPPNWLNDGPTLEAGDTWLHLWAELDWPGLVHLEVSGAPQSMVREILVQCAPASCRADGGEAGTCQLDARLSGLEPGTSYALTGWVEDDEGNRSAPLEQAFQTFEGLPAAELSEVMSMAPLPLPRAEGEYIEILNAGQSPLDPNGLALVGPDERVRPLVGRHERSAPPLSPGQRGLAVGSSFDPSRYQLASDVPLWRADTKKLLGRGLAEQPPAIHLVWLSSDGGTPVEIDRYPGDIARCQQGESLERLDQPDGGPPIFQCGAGGGSPGRAP